MYGDKVYYGWKNSNFIRIETSRELHGYIKRNSGLNRKIIFYVEISFHEIFVQQLGYDPYQIGENEGADGNNNLNTPNADHRKGGNDRQ